jgi:hypothetical protein
MFVLKLTIRVTHLLFEWQDMLKDDLMLMSLYTHRYLFVDPYSGSLCSADAAGGRPDRKEGACVNWQGVLPAQQEQLSNVLF